MADSDVHHCQTCNLCCDGTLFSEAWIEVGEREALAAKFDLIRSDGKLAFAQPCPQSTPNGCACYRERPQVCRAYRCTALNAFEAGSIDRATLIARIASARAALTAVHELAEAGASLKSIRAEQSKPGAAEANPALHMALGVLELLLDRHFREPGVRAMQVNPRSESGPPAASPSG
jgi:uncharacterized protein